MATTTITRGGDLPDSASKTDFHNLVDTCTLTISDIVNADINAAAAIADSKLATIATAGKVNITALIAASQASGDIISYNGSAWARVAIGTAGQFLTVNASANGLSWA